MGTYCQLYLDDLPEVNLRNGDTAYLITGDPEQITGKVTIYNMEADTEYKYIALTLIKKNDGVMIDTQNKIDKIYFLHNITGGNITLNSRIKFEYPFKILTPGIPPADTRIGVITFELVLQLKNPRRLALSKGLKKKILVLPK